MRTEKSKAGFVIIITSTLVLAVFLSILIISSCNVKVKEEPTPAITEYITPIPTDTPEPITTPTPTIEPTAVPTPTPRSGPSVVGIYQKVSNDRVLITQYNGKWRRGVDIGFFNTFASNDEVLNYMGYREMLVDSWFSYPNAEDYKIGYCLSYTLFTGEEFIITIKKPSDITHAEYLEVYLYDSVQQYTGGWYTHLDDEDMNDETMLYSFKLTPGVKIKEVSDIKLKTFAYYYNDESDFDPDTGEYIGIVSYEIDIIRQD